MRKIIKNNYKFILGVIVGLLISITTVYAVEAYIESNKVTYNNHNKENVQEAIDELYERSGIHQEEWQDPTLNESGNYPILQDNLIPVEIKPNGDTYYASTKSEWYNYREKRWANAVILNDDAVSKYSVGMQIEEDDIKGYFVWIPRYSYKIWDLGLYEEVLHLDKIKDTNEGDIALWKLAGSNSKLIDIKFVGTNTTETGSTVGTYLTHPAFKLGNKVLSGIWVGKFETGGTSEIDMVVKPNVSSWRNEAVKTFFNAGKSFANSLDSHMMKNTEWGAVAYLSHSEYGIGNEINVNNNSDYKTGYSATANSNQSIYLGETGTTLETDKTRSWNTPIGYLASTTGNISGIYDMSGGASEYVAACMEDTPGEISGFDEITLAKEMTNGYIDKYNKNSTETTYNYRILGDATGEIGPFYEYFESNYNYAKNSSWYSDCANFLNPLNPWLGRGGGTWDGVNAGIFYFYAFPGNGLNYNSFRLVLSIK